MKGVDTIARIRREFFNRGRSIKEIVREAEDMREMGEAAASWLVGRLGEMEEALAALVEDAERAVGELAIVPAAERAELERWAHGPALEIGAGATLHGEFARHAAASPDAPAVDDGRVVFSNGQVNSSVSYNNQFRSGEPYTVEFVSGTQLKITDSSGNDVTAEASQGGSIDPNSQAGQSVKFRGIDLNLLVTFLVLMRERSVSRAAAKLFIGQPAASAAPSFHESSASPLHSVPLASLRATTVAKLASCARQINHLRPFTCHCPSFRRA